MNQLNLFVELTRLKKPIGYMLLFWPCSWGLTLAYDFSSDLNIYFFYLLLFFLGSVLMRSAGCIVNDILDRKFDQKVFRTKNRPIASGKVSIKLALLYSLILCLIAFLVLINFNLFTTRSAGRVFNRRVVDDVICKEKKKKGAETRDVASRADPRASAREKLKLPRLGFRFCK